ncbi:MAG: hypothetical protein JNJ57_20095, partial [Saprospiraceae bacterium]|nr:hypothetical protein [Saprospiraceae bacterium]
PLASQAQTSSSTYLEATYIKVTPGMNESYLNANKIFKKLNNGRKEAKALNFWGLYRRVYPIKGSMDFDYAILELFPSGKEMQARKELTAWDEPVKGLTAKEISMSIGVLNTVRTIVARDVFDPRFGAGDATNLSVGDYVLRSKIKVSDANMEAYEKTLETVKPVMEEAMKSGKIKHWNVLKRAIATNVDGDYDFLVVFYFKNLDEALAYSSGITSVADEFKKVFPKDDFAAFRSKQIALREIIGQELWELVEKTD